MRSLHLHGNPCADCTAVRAYSDELKLQPMIAITGIDKNSSGEDVVWKFAAKDLNNVQLTVMTEVAKRSRATLLQMGDACAVRDIFKARAPHVVQETFRDDRAVIGRASRKVKIGLVYGML